MALLNLIIASLTAILPSFLSLSPNVFHGLAPWIERLNTSPMTPTPSAFTTAIWEEIPFTNLSAVDLAPQPTPAPSFTNDEDDEEPFVEPTAPASSFSAEDYDEVPPPESEEPTSEKPTNDGVVSGKESSSIIDAMTCASSTDHTIQVPQQVPNRLVEENRLDDAVNLPMAESLLKVESRVKSLSYLAVQREIDPVTAYVENRAMSNAEEHDRRFPS
ncbi:hypothetical protein MMC07_000962 [Pseudocyphellaria aurata]|nr:hypothetical protein [Pseudocyphellaria aurata]